MKMYVFKGMNGNIFSSNTAILWNAEQTNQTRMMRCRSVNYG